MSDETKSNLPAAVDSHQPCEETLIREILDAVPEAVTDDLTHYHMSEPSHYV